MAGQSVLLSGPVVAMPQERVCSRVALLKRVMLFEGLNLEPVVMVLLHALHPLGKVFGRILEDTGVGKGAL